MPDTVFISHATRELTRAYERFLRKHIAHNKVPGVQVDDYLSVPLELTARLFTITTRGYHPARKQVMADALVEALRKSITPEEHGSTPNPH